jgi:drug/metabolite transporter (DMT)-like permease
VYPVSRGATLLFLPALGAVAFRETVAPIGWLALAVILGGIVLLQRRTADSAASSASTAGPGFAYALLAALAAAGYTIWDKHAVQTLTAFAYFYAYTTLVAAAYCVWLSQRYSLEQVWSELRSHRWSIIQVAACNTVTYVLVLLALRTSTSTYVIALRQLSIAIGALLGWWLLGESLGRARQIGVALIVVGSLLIGPAR